ncbi:hypothetical protein WDU94_002591 [Cyamophila willieti]
MSTLKEETPNIGIQMDEIKEEIKEEIIISDGEDNPDEMYDNKGQSDEIVISDNSDDNAESDSDSDSDVSTMSVTSEPNTSTVNEITDNTKTTDDLPIAKLVANNASILPSFKKFSFDLSEKIKQEDGGNVDIPIANMIENNSSNIQSLFKPFEKIKDVDFMVNEKIKQEDVELSEKIKPGEKGSKAICSICGKWFKTEDRLKFHVVKYHGLKGDLVCQVCSQDFPCRKSLEEHKYDSVGSKCLKFLMREKKNFHSTKASYLSDFSEKIDLNKFEDFTKEMLKRERETVMYNTRHTRYDNVEWTCHVCAQILSSKGDLDDHVKIHDSKKWPCNLCSRKFESDKLLQKHKRLHTVSNNKNKISFHYLCDDCPRKFNSRKTLGVHLEIVHSSNETKRAVQFQRQRKWPKYKTCPHCATYFDSIKELKDHKKDVHGPKKVCQDDLIHEETFLIDPSQSGQGWNMTVFKCKECETVFENKTDLVEHIGTKHAGLILYGRRINKKARNKFKFGTRARECKNQICKHCSACFQTKKSLALHEFQEHKSDRHASPDFFSETLMKNHGRSNDKESSNLHSMSSNSNFELRDQTALKPEHDTFDISCNSWLDISCDSWISCDSNDTNTFNESSSPWIDISSDFNKTNTTNVLSSHQNRVSEFLEQQHLETKEEIDATDEERAMEIDTDNCDEEGIAVEVIIKERNGLNDDFKVLLESNDFNENRVDCTEVIFKQE